jgi:hypothetical protein
MNAAPAVAAAEPAVAAAEPAVAAAAAGKTLPADKDKAADSDRALATAGGVSPTALSNGSLQHRALATVGGVGNLTGVEARARGRVPLSVYGQYFSQTRVPGPLVGGGGG